MSDPTWPEIKVMMLAATVKAAEKIAEWLEDPETQSLHIGKPADKVMRELAAEIRTVWSAEEVDKAAREKGLY